MLSVLKELDYQRSIKRKHLNNNISIYYYNFYLFNNLQTFSNS
jgi:hypothetical protein